MQAGEEQIEKRFLLSDLITLQAGPSVPRPRVSMEGKPFTLTKWKTKRLMNTDMLATHTANAVEKAVIYCERRLQSHSNSKTCGMDDSAVDLRLAK